MQKTRSFRLGGSIVVLLLLFLALLRLLLLPRWIVATSPDGRYTVQVNAKNTLAELLYLNADNMISVVLIEKATGQRTTVEQMSSGGFLGDGHVPEKIRWHPQKSQFGLFLHQQAPSTDTAVRLYSVREHPLSAEVLGEDPQCPF